MPTTTDEARKILEISSNYITVKELKELFTRLDNEVGKVSENDSVKQSFIMFRGFAEAADTAVDKESDRARLTICWFLTCFFHHLLIFGNLVSFFVLPFKAAAGVVDWALVFPAMFAIIWVTCSPVNCAITNLENNFRTQLGWIKIRSFIGHYYLGPYRRWRRRSRRVDCDANADC